MGYWGMTSDAQLMAQERYDAANTRHISLKLNRKTDKDILEWLKRQESMQGAIRRLIREEIVREEKKAKRQAKKTVSLTSGQAG